MRLFGRDLIARILFKHDALARHQAEQLVIFLESLLLVFERLAHDLIDVMFVCLKQRTDLERRVVAEIRDVLARECRMRLRLVRLATIGMRLWPKIMKL